MELVQNENVLETALEYLPNDQEVREFVVYIQSEVYPKIHTTVHQLKEYTDVSAFMCMIFKPQSDGKNICSVSAGVWIALFYCSKFINDQGVDVYAIINDIHDNIEKQPFQPKNTTRMPVSIYRLIEDMIAVLPLKGLTTFFDNKMEIRELFQTLVRAIHNPVLMVNIHWDYFHVSCFYFMYVLLCEFLWSMHYSFPQNMVDKVQGWPEYPEVLQILREMFDDVERMSKLLWEIFRRGNVFNNWRCNVNSPRHLLTCLKYYDAEYHIDQIFQMTNIHSLS